MTTRMRIFSRNDLISLSISLTDILSDAQLCHMCCDMVTGMHILSQVDLHSVRKVCLKRTGKCRTNRIASDSKDSMQE